MSDPNHIELVAQIRSSECEIEALSNRIANAEDSMTSPSDYAAMRREQEEHRLHILKCKSEIDQNKWSE
jgi:hypothetical protein